MSFKEQMFHRRRRRDVEVKFKLIDQDDPMTVIANRSVTSSSEEMMPQPSQPRSSPLPRSAEASSSSPPRGTAVLLQQSSRRSLPKCIFLHYSPFKAVWDWVILLLVLYTAVVTPYTAAFLLNEDQALMELHQDPKTRTSTGGNRADPLIIIDLIVDVMFIADILISFRTTYVHSGDVISEPQKIARNYIKGWFLLDAIAAIPLDLLLFGSGGQGDTMTIIGILKTVRLLRLLRVIRRINQYSEYGSAVLLLLMSTFTLVAHWLACIWYAIGYMERDTINPRMGWLNILADTYGRFSHNSSLVEDGDLHTKYITALYFTCTTLTSIGFGNVSPTTNAEKIFAIFAMLLGSLMSAAIFGNVSSMMLRLYQGTEEFHERVTSIKEFIHFHRIPKTMSQRLLESFQSSWQFTNGVDMNGVLRNFPECLQADICLHMNRNLLNNCALFQSASPGCLRAFAMKFRSIHVAPGNTMIHPGDILDATYFIARGTLEILQNVNTNTTGENQVATLGKDDIFGLNARTALTGGKQQSHYLVRALTYVDLNKITFVDLQEILSMYPEWRNQFLRRFRITIDLTQVSNSATSLDLEAIPSSHRLWSLSTKLCAKSPHSCPTCQEVTWAIQKVDELTQRTAALEVKLSESIHDILRGVQHLVRPPTREGNLWHYPTPPLRYPLPLDRDRILPL